MDPSLVLDHIDRTAYPWTPKTAIVDAAGHEMAYLDEGSGRPVVLVHGNPVWSYVWRDVVRALPDARCIAPDHIGFGCSDKPRDPSYYTLERHILNLTALLRALDLDDVTLVVHDWGGPIGLGWAVRHPERIGRLVILNTFAMRPDGFLKVPWFYKALRAPGIGEIVIQKSDLYLDRVFQLGIAEKARRSAATLQAYKAPFALPDDRVGLLRFVRGVPYRADDDGYALLGEIEAGLPSLDVPVRILWARRDPVFGKRIAHRFAELLPQGDASAIVDFPRASHFMQEDDPDTLAAEIRAFHGA